MKDISDICSELLETIIPEIVEILDERGPIHGLYSETPAQGAIELIIRWIIRDNGYCDDSDHIPAPGLDQSRFKLQRLNIGIDRLPFLYERLLENERSIVPEASGKKPVARRRLAQGMFYTPDEIVNHIVTRSFKEFSLGKGSWQDVKILDPAMGGGLFLKRAIKEVHNLAEAPAPSPEAILRNNIYGVDLDPIAVLISSALLAFCANRTGSARVHARAINLRRGNALIGSTHMVSGHKSSQDWAHARLYLGGNPDQERVESWKADVFPFHWGLEFPEVFKRDNPGFDIIVGNPPYEVLSVKETGIRSRKFEQAYFRMIFKSATGKINLYRLMLERSLNLLRDGGVLGLILPATLLGDTTAASVRRELLDSSRVAQTLIIPEKARIFRGVTQACLILIAIKGEKTHYLAPARWNETGENHSTEGIRVSRRLIDLCGSRTPILDSEEEKGLLEAISSFPPLGGSAESQPLADFRQGEINMTLDRDRITDKPTPYKLIRGEHVTSFRLSHPSVKKGKLDWVRAEWAMELLAPVQTNMFSPVGTKPWAKRRVAVARVVNMATKVRLKAAKVRPGEFQGDMTNCLFDLKMEMDLLIGLLNSALLNWRFKKTSANNYVSIAELMALPIAGALLDLGDPDLELESERIMRFAQGDNDWTQTDLADYLQQRAADDQIRAAITAVTIRRISRQLQDGAQEVEGTGLERLLNGLTLILYNVERFDKVLGHS